MTVQCIGCQHFSMRDAGQMAKQGFGHCGPEANRASFQSAVYPRQRRKFLAADQDTVDKRQAWLDWEKKRFLKEILSHDET